MVSAPDPFRAHSIKEASKRARPTDRMNEANSNLPADDANAWDAPLVSSTATVPSVADYYKRSAPAGSPSLPSPAGPPAAVTTPTAPEPTPGAGPPSRGHGQYRRHVAFVREPRPRERVERRGAARKPEASAAGAKKQVRFAGVDGVHGRRGGKGGNFNGRHSKIGGGLWFASPAPASKDAAAMAAAASAASTLPRLKKQVGEWCVTTQSDAEMSLAESLGRRVKVDPRELRSRGRAGAQVVMRGTPSRVEEETSLRGEQFFSRKVDLITFKRFVASLKPAPAIGAIESMSTRRQHRRRQEREREVRTVVDLPTFDGA